MRKVWQIAWMMLCVVFVVSCNKEDNTLEVDEEWKALNEEAWNAQLQEPGWERLNSLSNAGFILYRVIEEGDSDEPIYYTSQVECHYTGRFVDGTVFNDFSFEHGAPTIIEISKMTDGFATALQYMHPGDRWEICVPYQLAYGESGDRRSNSDGTTTTILPYSNLIFDIQVTRVVVP